MLCLPQEMELVRVWVASEESHKVTQETSYTFSMNNNMECETTKKLLLLGCMIMSMGKED